MIDGREAVVGNPDSSGVRSLRVIQSPQGSFVSPIAVALALAIP